MMGYIDITTSMGVTGSGFYPSGSVTLTVTSGSITSTFLTTADSSGDINYSIPISSINGLGNSSTITLTAKDNTTGISSNTATINVNVENVAPTLTAPTSSIQLATSSTTSTSSSSSSSSSSSYSLTISATPQTVTLGSTTTITGATVPATSGQTVTLYSLASLNATPSQVSTSTTLSTGTYVFTATPSAPAGSVVYYYTSTSNATSGIIQVSVAAQQPSVSISPTILSISKSPNFTVELSNMSASTQYRIGLTGGGFGGPTANGVQLGDMVGDITTDSTGDGSASYNIVDVVGGQTGTYTILVVNMANYTVASQASITVNS